MNFARMDMRYALAGKVTLSRVATDLNCLLVSTGVGDDGVLRVLNKEKT